MDAVFRDLNMHILFILFISQKQKQIFPPVDQMAAGFWVGKKFLGIPCQFILIVFSFLVCIKVNIHFFKKFK